MTEKHIEISKKPGGTPRFFVLYQTSKRCPPAMEVRSEEGAIKCLVLYGWSMPILIQLDQQKDDDTEGSYKKSLKIRMIFLVIES
jgi:hypothetical protein